jgi:hypothetical protein
MMISTSDIRQDLVLAHENAWAALSAPGTWWSGAQRIELARTALLAIDELEPTPPWVAISTVVGKLPQDLSAPKIAHDCAYRIARHAATLTRDWYQKAVREISELAFVELCGIVCTVATVSAFRRAAGLAPLEFSEVKDGEPTQIKPTNIVSATLNWVPVVSPADENAAVVQAFTAVPETNRLIWSMADAQYIPDKEMVDPRWSRGTLSRMLMELIATRVSQQRECFY